MIHPWLTWGDVWCFSMCLCFSCLLSNRLPLTMVESDVCMCKRCWDECTEDMRHVVRHRNNHHKRCPKEYPASEVRLTHESTAAKWMMHSQMSQG